ncbi:chaperone [Dioszegia hungarica]|uniref:Chaperone n=1 Tax=Dioszegia hungarica TaxID=4972 RepID=A0AA38H5G6_9TREE|nr:chaperone [Dioszegia hungarica]KAI9634877.1 chaperone [Dioszegia hungarica]
MRLVPATTPVSNEQHLVSVAATAHPVTGTHDAMRYGLKTAAQGLAAGNQSPLQARLEKWASTQSSLNQTIQRANFGLAVPLRQAMEIKLVAENPHNPLMLSSSAHPVGGSHNLALEILSGADETLDAQDFMGGDRLLGEVVDVTSAMERSRGI